jgi:hypothetical protein
MAAELNQPITELLRAAQAGDDGAAERLLAAVYGELHQLARARMAHLPPGQTLQPTALVHDAYLRLTDKTDAAWESRRHFFFAAARAMRDILVEQARRKARPVRGGTLQAGAGQSRPALPRRPRPGGAGRMGQGGRRLRLGCRAGLAAQAAAPVSARCLCLARPQTANPLTTSAPRCR